ncbi:MAG TPA: HD domain-containing protein [Candidatus Eisenbacteria bacterium]|nr:HD domain-containing protein [Candidatus Eisenbacteria bacterium]
MPDSLLLLQAIAFAADKHRDQRRKDKEASPYINHPIAVALLLAQIGAVTDEEVLAAAILHDTLEDTATTPEELELRFGPRVRRIVAEVTDDKSRPADVRKQLQIDHARDLSPEAVLVKLGDKTANILDVTHSPPKHWSTERKAAYLDWAESVVRACPNVNAALEENFYRALAEARRTLLSEG